MEDNNKNTNVSNDLTDEKRDFDEDEAYFMLCQIISNAQATKDYAKFTSDLIEWQKRFPVNSFSEKYKSKIKYMLSNEFLYRILEGFRLFDELSQKDPAEGLRRLRKVLNNAKKHKDPKTLKKDLNELYKEYPLDFFKTHYPHMISKLLSTDNIENILQKFDPSDAFKELENITLHTNTFENAQDLTEAIEEWKVLFPVDDFPKDYQDRVNKVLTEFSDARKLEELFPISTEINLDEGTVIPLELHQSLEEASLTTKNALYDFFKIVNKNVGDIDGLFDWICKYNRYINDFDKTTKTVIVTHLMQKYLPELPPATDYRIPGMDSGENDLLSFKDYTSLNDTKRATVLQLFGILFTERELTHEDIYRLNILSANSQKAEFITERLEKSKLELELSTFMEQFPEDELTFRENYFSPEVVARTDCDNTENADLYFDDADKVDLTFGGVDLTVDADTPNTAVIEQDTVPQSGSNFKETIKVEQPVEDAPIGVALERLSSNSTGSSGESSSGGSSSGGASNSIGINDVKTPENDQKNETSDKPKATDKPQQTVATVLTNDNSVQPKTEQKDETPNTADKAKPARNNFIRNILTSLHKKNSTSDDSSELDNNNNEQTNTNNFRTRDDDL